MNFNIEDLIPFFGIMMPVAIIFIIFYYRSKAREDVQKTIRLSIEKGQPLPPEMIQSIQKNSSDRSPARDFRRGILCLAVGIGFFGWSYVKHGFETTHEAGFAVFMCAIGLAFIGLGLIGNRFKS